MHLLRRGERIEVQQASQKVNTFLEEAARDELRAPLLLGELHRNNALQTLLSAFVRCSAWPEVETSVSSAIAQLVAIEDEGDWQQLQQSAREILSSLQVLVSAQNYAGSRETIAKAVFKLCFVLSKQWSQTHVPFRPPSIGGGGQSDMEGIMSYREHRRNRGLSRLVTDIGLLLGMIAHIISLLLGDESGAAIDETTVLCSSAMLSLSRVRQGKQSFVTHGSMALVTRWLEEARFVLADAFNRNIALPEDHLVYKLIVNTCGILLAVVAPGDHAESAHEYSIGWADSQIIAMGIPSTIAR